MQPVTMAKIRVQCSVQRKKGVSQEELFGDLQTEKDVQIPKAADPFFLCITVHCHSNVLLSLKKHCNATLRFS